MKNFIICIILILSIKLSAQNNLIGIKGGIDWTNIQTTNQYIDHTFKTEASGGLTYDYFITKRFSVGADLLYLKRGYNSNLIFTDNVGNPLNVDALTAFKFNYLALPIKIGFNMGNKLFAFANIGICPSYIVDARIVIPQTDSKGNITGEYTSNVTSKVTKFELSGIAELGCGYTLKDKYSIYASCMYQKSFTNIDNKDFFNDSKIKNYGFLFSLGVKYSLTK